MNINNSLYEIADDCQRRLRRILNGEEKLTIAQADEIIKSVHDSLENLKQAILESER